MKQKSLRVVVSFHTTAAAMAAEQLCRRENLEGKLISVPRSITSDCGIAWSAPPALRPVLEEKFQQARLEVAGFHELMV